jgi:hypothetical protein
MMSNIVDGFLIVSILLWSCYTLFIGVWKDTPSPMCKCGKNPKCKCK